MNAAAKLNLTVIIAALLCTACVGSSDRSNSMKPSQSGTKEPLSSLDELNHKLNHAASNMHSQSGRLAEPEFRPPRFRLQAKAGNKEESKSSASGSGITGRRKASDGVLNVPKLQLQSPAVSPPAGSSSKPSMKTKSKPDIKPKPKKRSLPVHQFQMSQRRLSLSELRVKYSSFFKVHGASSLKRVALTFDDGPDSVYTPQILDILKKHHVKATFFLLGSRAQTNPNVVRRIVNEGHVIGNHSFSHPLFTKISVPNFEQQIERTQHVLSGLIGYKPKLVRPPYGEITEPQLRWMKRNHFFVVNWDIDSLDWKELNMQQVTDNVLPYIHPGAIILQHSAGGNRQNLSGTVKALPRIIQKLKDDGYRIVTVPQLLNISPYQ